ncbi:MAG: hypothetical protein K2W89_08880 [Sphingomonas ginsenosidimutans]|uniref:hypothetical protein n=1 Tax=Sphingomonas sp. CCH9-F2 TaxID=1768778 RepID=UPI000A805CF5|nr:hypothetical protein [Sphingomonas sp. CCH9-F2]MBY0301840.1 hypothetical protein [Sphingomonas ginsenosidimutans]
MAMEPEDGRISIIDNNEDDAPSVTALTRDGINYLKETLSDPSSCYYKLSPRPSPDGYSASNASPCRRAPR